ncbi:TetR family transcriptional regulator [Nocardiopsis sp. CNT312]|uniref:TetR/AcrR family transcriptional regulator n=1 Tax=Nocardiopsis sp. CNT312 TaxID=1137268 RepID=UPI0004915778
MCSAPRRPPEPEEDLTARARIRGAAIACFGQKGFGVPVRTIAERAGVSPALVMHHFGSKAGLRRACDEHVRNLVYEIKKDSVTTADQRTFLDRFAGMDEYAPYVAYFVRSFQAGGDIAHALFEHMVEDIENYLAAGEEAGTVRPSRDPAARARFLAMGHIGSLQMFLTMHFPGPDIDFREVMRAWSERITLPTLEIYSEGLFTNRAMLDAYLLYVGDPPEEES